MDGISKAIKELVDMYDLDIIFDRHIQSKFRNIIQQACEKHLIECKTSDLIAEISNRPDATMFGMDLNSARNLIYDVKKIKEENKRLWEVLKGFLSVNNFMKEINVKSFDKYKTLLSELMKDIEVIMKENNSEMNMKTSSLGIENK